MSRTDPGEASLLANELRAVINAAELEADTDHDAAVLLVGAAARLARDLAELTQRIELEYRQHWAPDFSSTNEEVRQTEN